jgi:mono/diheme cytochrome c family protein
MKLIQSSKFQIVLIALATGTYTASAQTTTPSLAGDLGISFPTNSQSAVVLVKDGKKYLIDVSSKTVKELPAESPSSSLQASAAGAQGEAAAQLFARNCAVCHGPDGRGIKSVGTPNFRDASYASAVSAEEMRAAIEHGKGGIMPAWSGKLSEAQISSLVTYIRSLPGGASTAIAKGGSSTSQPEQAQQKPKIYEPGDDVLVSLPSGRPTDRHGVYVNFAHRFPYQPAFTGPNEGATLFGLDNVAIPSLGVRYGVTDNLSVSVFRAPSLVNRPIQLMAGYNILEERKGDPLNLMVRASIEGEDNFRKNYTENIEGILSRSVTSHAQFYLVPTLSINDRRLEQPAGFESNQILDVPGVNSFTLGIGMAVDVRPSVVLLAEVIPTLLNARELDVHRPAMSFGIQKKIWRHAFTLALTTSPGTTVSQRAFTRAQFLNAPSADTFGGLFFAFNITRQIK